MPTKYLPKKFSPVTAVKLKEDLIAERGSWISIDEDGVIRQFTDQQFCSIYSTMPKIRKGSNSPRIKTTEATDKPKPVEEIPGVKISNRTEEGLVRTCGGRILHILNIVGMGMPTTEIAEYIPKDKASIAGRLSEMLYFGLVSKEKINNRFVWTITDHGSVILNKFYPSMYTKFDLEIPKLKSNKV